MRKKRRACSAQLRGSWAPAVTRISTVASAGGIYEQCQSQGKGCVWHRLGVTRCLLPNCAVDVVQRTAAAGVYQCHLSQQHRSQTGAAGTHTVRIMTCQHDTYIAYLKGRFKAHLGCELHACGCCATAGVAAAAADNLFGQDTPWLLHLCVTSFLLIGV
jgi:hypothetical protein